MFSLPLPESRQIGLPLSSRNRKRKRKRQQENDSGPQNAGTKEQADGVQSTQFLYDTAVTPEERSQRLVAGCQIQRRPPKFPFPHAPLSEHTTSSPGLKDSPTAATDVSPSESQSHRSVTLHRQHLAALIALIHRSLVAKDWTRAERALGLILRDRFDGQDIDIRAGEIWGVGAEILLRQGALTPMPALESMSQHPTSVSEEDRQPKAPQWCSTESFEKSKRYYENLIIQYPFHKSHPGVRNALDFYHAMYGLWIYLIQDQAKRDENFPEESSSWEKQTPAPGPKVHFDSKLRELERAEEMSSHLDATMTTFPFRYDAELIRLKGMVQLWVADLLDVCLEHLETIHRIENESPETVLELEQHLRKVVGVGDLEDNEENTLGGKSERLRLLGHETLQKLHNGIRVND